MADYTENSNVQNFERYNSDGTKKKEKKSGKGGYRELVKDIKARRTKERTDKSETT